MTDEERQWEAVVDGATAILDKTLDPEGFILFTVRETQTTRIGPSAVDLSLKVGMRTNIESDIVRQVLERYYLKMSLAPETKQ